MASRKGWVSDFVSRLTDAQRWSSGCEDDNDKHVSTVCVSFAFPNIYYKYRERLKQHVPALMCGREVLGTALCSVLLSGAVDALLSGVVDGLLRLQAGAKAAQLLFAPLESPVTQHWIAEEMLI